mgnify:CR=1 FL=1
MIFPRLVLSLWATLNAAPLLAQSLTFEAALQLAEQNQPTISAAAARVDAAWHAVQPAGQWPDPKLAIGIDNLPINGADRLSLSTDPMTMQRFTLMQEMPNSVKREARVAAAQARALGAETQLIQALQTLRRETALAWIKRNTADEQLKQFDALVTETEILLSTAPARLLSGSLSTLDALLPRQEAALLADRRDELLAQQAQATAALRRWVGEAATQALAGSAPIWVLERSALTHNLHRHPELRQAKNSTLVLEAELREAQAMKKPDWAVELGYQRRAAQFGDMVSVQLTFELPLLGRQRQDPTIAVKQAERAAVAAEQDALAREHQQTLENDWADLQRFESAIKRNQTTLQTIASERLKLSMAAYAAGKAPLLDPINARRELLELQLKLLSLQGERQATAARLHFAFDAAELRARHE